MFFFFYRGASLFGPRWHLGYVLRIPASNSIPFTGTASPPLPWESALGLCPPLEQLLPSLSSYSKTWELSSHTIQTPSQGPVLSCLSFILPQSTSFISLFSIHAGLLSVLQTCEALCYLLFGGLCTCRSLCLERSSAELAPQYSELSSNDTSLQKLFLSKFSSILFCLFTAPIICLYLIFFSCLSPLLHRQMHMGKKPLCSLQYPSVWHNKLLVNVQWIHVGECWINLWRNWLRVVE